MVRVKVTIPPVMSSPVDIGEIDTELMRSRGRVVWHVGEGSFVGYAVTIEGGSLVYVPDIQADRL